MHRSKEHTACLLGKGSFLVQGAIIYGLHVRAFFDSNNDGIGDFRGLTQKLDYLQELGVTALGLLPFYPSPLKDDGYDIADYFSINPMNKPIQRVWTFNSDSEPAKEYQTLQYTDGSTSCNCAGWTWRAPSACGIGKRLRSA